MDDYTQESIFRQDAIAFCRECREHWKQIVGGGFVFIVIGQAAALGFSLPQWVTFIASFCGAVAWAAFRSFCSERRKTERAIAAACEANNRHAVLLAAKDNGEEAHRIATATMLAHKPRTITPAQREFFIHYLHKAKRRPVRVICYSNAQEAIEYAEKIREALDAAGFTDEEHNGVECIIGPGIRTPNHETTAIAYHSKEEVWQDFNREKDYANIMNAFRHQNIPVAAIVSDVLKAGEIAVVAAQSFFCKSG